ncbi:hypothetical protein [Ehrlichia canis]|uniref:hypothetical protein n=1 Tax=Ehrlichia canis TaxID=944 RepID=UPI00131527D6|nr:hypothetical protein [Ehrlichia canis]UKC53643.1 hypothetical protein s20019040002_000686 [Ehrlichia canis]UKC54581.1 hypothetical protein s20026770001_000687 [Ehrlichia canis]UKC55517.1 hypothetical protein s21009500007_000687 [Ehrlichia canis]
MSHSHAYAIIGLLVMCIVMLMLLLLIAMCQCCISMRTLDGKFESEAMAEQRIQELVDENQNLVLENRELSAACKSANGKLSELLLQMKNLLLSAETQSEKILNDLALDNQANPCTKKAVQCGVLKIRQGIFDIVHNNREGQRRNIELGGNTPSKIPVSKLRMQSLSTLQSENKVQSCCN